MKKELCRFGGIAFKNSFLKMPLGPPKWNAIPEVARMVKDYLDGNDIETLIQIRHIPQIYKYATLISRFNLSMCSSKTGANSFQNKDVFGPSKRCITINEPKNCFRELELSRWLGICHGDPIKVSSKRVKFSLPLLR